MTWPEIGWVIIALAALLLVVFNFWFKHRGRYPARTQPAVKSFAAQRVCAVERGQQRWVLLGDQFWSRAYPGLGLQALSVFTSLSTVDPLADEGHIAAAGTGELALFARQIAQGRYQGGVSTGLVVALPGPTPFSFLAGAMAELGLHPLGSLGLFGNYGQTGVLLAEATEMKGGHLLAAAGSVDAQAALFLATRDLLIAEEVFMLPGLFDPTPSNQAGWVSEDILRVALMVLLVIAAGLKMAGVI
ncbi:MAG: hypothetical protein ACNA70_00770 [Brevefilum sp.]